MSEKKKYKVVFKLSAVGCEDKFFSHNVSGWTEDEMEAYVNVCNKQVDRVISVHSKEEVVDDKV